MHRQVVHLDDDAVDLVLHVVAVLAVMTDECGGLGRAGDHAEVRADRKTPRRQQAVHLALGRDRRIRPGPDPVHREPQPRQPLMHRLQLTLVLALALLAQRSRRGVPRVGEQAVALLLLEGVQRVEVGDCEEDLAAHLDQRRMPVSVQRRRDARDAAHVLRHVFADATVSTRGGTGQPAVLVAKRQREAVDLEFAQERHHAAGIALHACRPYPEFVLAEDVVQAQHALGVRDRREQRAGGRANGERRGILALQFRVEPLELVQALHPAVVGGVVDDLRIVAVIGVARGADAVGEVSHLVARLVESQLSSFTFSHPVSLWTPADTTVGRGRSGIAATLMRRRERLIPSGRS